MNIVNKTQIEQDLEQIQKLADRAQQYITVSANSINKSFNAFWSLPDDRLQTLLQDLVDRDMLTGIFASHELAATSINAILADIGYEGSLCKTVPTREFSIEDGKVVVVPLPEPETDPIVED